MFKNKNYYIIVLLLVSNFAWANSDFVKCDIEGQNQDQSVELSERLPELNFHQKFTGPNGESHENIENLITESTVSSYNIPKTDCSIQMLRMIGKIGFSFYFNCKDLDGYLKFDSANGTGEYFQQLNELNVTKSFKFKNCTAK